LNEQNLYIRLGEVLCSDTNNCNGVCVLCAVPPRWVVEPTDASVERNKHVTLHCQAQGVPQPAIIWKKATGMDEMKQR